jgi:hypothetical protein
MSHSLSSSFVARQNGSCSWAPRATGARSPDFRSNTVFNARSGERFADPGHAPTMKPVVSNPLNGRGRRFGRMRSTHVLARLPAVWQCTPPGVSASGGASHGNRVRAAGHSATPGGLHPESPGISTKAFPGPSCGGRLWERRACAPTSVSNGGGCRPSRASESAPCAARDPVVRVSPGPL